MNACGNGTAFGQIDNRWLIEMLRQRSDRKLRLVACALCRVIWDRLADSARQAVRFGEEFADGNGDEAAREEHFARLRAAGGSNARRLELWLPACTVVPGGRAAAEFAVGAGVEPDVELAVIRDIFGGTSAPPFRPAWRTADVVALATHIYTGRDFSAMPILADALQDTGCDNDDVLTHCRDATALHVRGCWVVDEVLGKG